MHTVLYSKSSNERDRRFALHTMMLQKENGEKCFYKLPDSPEAEQHVQRIAVCEEKLKNFYDPEQIRINQCTRYEKGVRLEYLEGRTLEDEIDRVCREEGTEAAETLIDAFFQRTQPGQKQEPFAETEEFRTVFGSRPELDGLPAISPADIDMIFSNVICDPDGWHLIDYEWTFFFPVPAEFLRYRALHYFLETSSRREWLREAGWERWHILPAHIPVWEEMEVTFQKYIMGAYTPLQELYVQMSPGAADPRALDDPDRKLREDKIRIYWSEDETLTEDQTLLFPLTEGWNTIRTRLPEGTRKIRLDPGERSAVCSLRKWTADGKPVAVAAHNGVQLSDRVWVFPQDDPQWTAASERSPMSVVEIEIKVQQMDADLLESYKADAGRTKRKRRFF